MQRLTIWQCTPSSGTPRTLKNIRTYYGEDIGDLNHPCGLITNAINREFDPDADVIYLADRDNNRILELTYQPDPQGGSLRCNRILGQGYVHAPVDITIANYGSFLMDNVDFFIVGLGQTRDNGELVRLGINGDYKETWNKVPFPDGWPDMKMFFDYPVGIASYPDTLENTSDLYITELTSNTMFVLSVTPSTKPEYFDAWSLEMGEPSYQPGGIAFDGFGRVYVANAMKGKIESFGPEMTDFYPPFGAFGTGNNQFNSPRNIVIDNYDGLCEALIFEYYDRNSGLTTYDISNGYSEETRPQGFKGQGLFRYEPQIPVPLPKAYSLHDAYPNPFNTECTIVYDIPEKTNVSITIFNILGQRVAKLVDETQEPGTHSVVFGTTGLASGTYFYTLRTENYSATKAVTLVK